MRARVDLVRRGDRFGQVDFDRFDAAVRQSAQTLSHRHHRRPHRTPVPDDKANINQREVGIDCLSAEALRALVRKTPTSCSWVKCGTTRPSRLRSERLKRPLGLWNDPRVLSLLEHGQLRPLPRRRARTDPQAAVYNLQAIIYQRLLPTLKPSGQ